MATVIIKAHVAYPRVLIDKFEEQRELREQAGESSCRPLFEPSEPNHVYFIAEWQDLEQANEFWLSDRWRLLAEDWSAVEETSIMVLDGAS